jgi:hypothetical protein
MGPSKSHNPMGLHGLLQGWLYFFLLISVRGWVDPRAIVQLEVLGKLKNPMTSSRLKPTTIQACSIAPQPTTLPRAPYEVNTNLKYFSLSLFPT